VARMLRRVGDEDSAGMIILLDGNAVGPR